MNKAWLIAKHEYTRHVFRWRFFIVLFLLPAMIVVMYGIILFLLLQDINRDPVGYVDNGGVMFTQSGPESIFNTILRIKFLPYPDEPSARAALEKKELQAFIVLPKDYRQTLKAHLVYNQPPSPYVMGILEDLLRLNLLKGQPQDLTQRVINGPRLSIETTDEKQAKPGNQLLQFVIPFAMSFFLVLATMNGASYLIQAVVEEKENRMMEILATSAKPLAIMSGKIFGLLFVSLTELFLYAFPLFAGILLLAAFIPAFQDPGIWIPVIAAMVTAPPTLLMMSTIIAILGVTLVDAREGQMAAFFVVAPLMIPYLLLNPLNSDPSGTLATVLSFFPLTASTTLLVRMAVSDVPAWQILTSTGILILSAAGTLWLAGYAFRQWILRNGKLPDWKAILRKVLPLHFKKGAA